MLKIDLTVGPFYAAVRQAMIVTSEERRGVDFVFGGGKIVLSGHGAELGESHVELPIAYDGDGDRHHARPPLSQRFPQGVGPRAELHDRIAQRGKRRRLHDRRRLRLRHHAAGAGCVSSMPQHAVCFA